MSTYIGVSHQYKIEAAGGTVITVYVQNLGQDEAPRRGETVTLSWKPEHTFAVAPQEGPRSMEEDEDMTKDGNADRSCDRRALMRGMTQRRISRRDLIKYGRRHRRHAEPGSRSSRPAVATRLRGAGEEPPGSSVDFTAEPGAEINFANWPLYIDKAKDPETGDASTPRS